MYFKRLTHQARFLSNALFNYPWSLRENKKKKMHAMQNVKNTATWFYDFFFFFCVNRVLTNLRNIRYEFKSWIPKSIISIDKIV